MCGKRECRQHATPTGRQRGIARGRRPVNGFVASSYSAAEPLAAPTTRTTNPWPNALRSVLLDRGGGRRPELAAVEYGVVALLAFLEADRGGEHVSSALGSLSSCTHQFVT